MIDGTVCGLWTKAAICGREATSMFLAGDSGLVLIWRELYS